MPPIKMDPNNDDFNSLRTGQLRRLRGRWLKMLRHKQGQMEKHSVGTSYHTRASKDAAFIARCITAIENAIHSRGASLESQKVARDKPVKKVKTLGAATDQQSGSV